MVKMQYDKTLMLAACALATSMSALATVLLHTFLR
jgi:hypothetical protein